ncbi:flippase [Cupriavidus pauculus]|uniref:Flippase n=1 Tax=Cupriavidus pauculus TaxID=82633 RepID=A0A2N5CHA2_9BURK|nr:flippase [Cupriavidus pauculus]PLQ01545.1 flippase [Cupriavidus pauculus]
MRASHISWNLFGLGLPLLIAAATVPHLLSGLGSQRFGLLALAWGLIGYASALDLGIGRATTQRVSALRDGHDEASVPDVLATATRLTLVTGGIGMVVIMLAAMLGVGQFVHADNVPQTEIRSAILLLGLALPMQAVSATYRGVNEAYLSFRNISVLRILLGAANFGLPYLISLYSTRVDLLIASLVVSRALALWFYRVFALNCLPAGSPRGTYLRPVARQLFQFGGWFTISSVLSPLLTQADRFLIAAILGAAAVTTYVIPYELTVQTLILSSAVTTVAFPAISRLLVTDPDGAQRLFGKWMLRVVGAMILGLIVLALILPPLLTLWLGHPADPDSVKVGRILCIGVLANAVGSMYFALLHARGKTRATAILHVVEVPLYIAALVGLTKLFGVSGAAIAWSLRMFFDALGMKFLARRAS